MPPGRAKLRRPFWKNSAAVRAEGERESEGDAALATYLWLPGNHRRDLAQIAAGSVREWRQLFWARMVADDLRLVNGSANACRGASRGFRRMQSGFVQNYVLVMGAGIVLITVVYLFTKP